MRTTTAVAWTMHAPSVSGGKDYKILLFNRFVVIGWGATMGTMQFKVAQFNDYTAAQSYALAQTQQKESKGYQMIDEPTASDELPEVWAIRLPGYVGHRGGSSVLEYWITNVLRKGTLLAMLSV